jgi:hypothetical protein
MKRPAAPARASEAVTLEFDHETIVYNCQTGAVHRLDATGSIVWKLLEGHSTIDELVTDLSAAFAVDPSVVHNDVRNLLERLEQGFLLADGPLPEPHPRPSVLTNPPSR